MPRRKVSKRTRGSVRRQLPKQTECPCALENLGGSLSRYATVKKVKTSLDRAREVEH